MSKVRCRIITSMQWGVATVCERTGDGGLVLINPIQNPCQTDYVSAACAFLDTLSREQIIAVTERKDSTQLPQIRVWYRESAS